MELTKNRYEELLKQHGNVYVCTIEDNDFAFRKFSEVELGQLTALVDKLDDAEVLKQVMKIILFPSKEVCEMQFENDGFLFDSLMGYIAKTLVEEGNLKGDTKLAS